jgi:hypothetical protein
MSPLAVPNDRQLSATMLDASIGIVSVRLETTRLHIHTRAGWRRASPAIVTQCRCEAEG